MTADAAATDGEPDRAAVRALVEAGIPVLVLAEGGGDGDGKRPPTRVLVPPAQAARARAVLDAFEWRYSWASVPYRQLVPMHEAWWDGGAEIEVAWALAAPPAPSRVLRRLTLALWASAELAADGTMRPPAAVAAVEAAVAAALAPREERGAALARFRDLLAATSPDELLRVAASCGVASALRWALAADASHPDRLSRPRPFDGLAGVGFVLARAAAAHARPARLRRLLLGRPALGDVTIRARVAGVETASGPGVFVPTPDADRFVELALAALPQPATDARRPVVIEVGCGSGAIALAVAVHRLDARVVGAELDARAVRWARRNAARLGLDVPFVAGSLLDPVPSSLRGDVDVILANLPFYPPRRVASVGSIPDGAIGGTGEDGLGLLRELAGAARSWLRPGGTLVLQLFGWQWDGLRRELEALGYRTANGVAAGPFVIAPSTYEPAAASPPAT